MLISLQTRYPFPVLKTKHWVPVNPSLQPSISSMPLITEELVKSNQQPVITWLERKREKHAGLQWWARVYQSQRAILPCCSGCLHLPGDWSRWKKIMTHIDPLGCVSQETGIWCCPQRGTDVMSTAAAMPGGGKVLRSRKGVLKCVVQVSIIRGSRVCICEYCMCLSGWV